MSEWAAGLLGCVILVGWVGAEETRVTDEQQALLQVRKAQVRLETERAESERTRELFEQGLASRTEMDRVQAEVATARLEYEEKLLLLLGQHPRLSVREAVKEQRKDGRRFVRVAVQNLTPLLTDSQMRLLAGPGDTDPLVEELMRRELRDVFVSLRSPGGPDLPVRGTAIALPYEAELAVLQPGGRAELTFQLLRDITSAVICWTYRGQVQEFDVQLQQAVTENVVTVSSTQISQEVELSHSAAFDLRLERSGVDVQQFHLRAANLPRAVSSSFVDPSTQARVSQISFPTGVTQVSLSLRVSLPDRADKDLPLDRPLPFSVLVMDETQVGQFRDERAYTPEEIRQSRAGHASLAIIPRGLGRVEIAAASLFAEIAEGDEVQTSLTLRNAGTRRVDNIRVSTDHPLDWQVDCAPDIVPALEINQEEAIALRVTPPADVGVGDYEVRIKTECFADGRRLSAEEKIFRVSVRARTNVWAMVGLLGGLLVFACAVVIIGARLARR